jgi:phosphoadenosine phosphosulfate reductase
MDRSNTDQTRAAAKLNRRFANLTLEERLNLVGEQSLPAVFTTSLGMEDQVLTWAIAMSGQPVRIATLQTGRLFPETLSLLRVTRDRYGIEIAEHKPDSSALNSFIDGYGSNGFYNSIEARKACCNTRKLAPLTKALAGAGVWITGLRRGQSDNRQSVNFVEWDTSRRLLKVNPLADWSSQKIRDAVAAHEIPVNPLHARGYASIGCEPCTRAIKPGEPERAGRWWWEQDDSRECGLHVESPTTLATPATAVSPEGVEHHHA